MPGRGGGSIAPQALCPCPLAEFEPPDPHPTKPAALRRALTYARTDGHKHVGDGLRVIHHDSLHSSIQHADLQGSLFLPVLHGVLLEMEQEAGAHVKLKVFLPFYMARGEKCRLLKGRQQWLT